MKHIKPLVSVIVPIYNVEKYLEKCLTSLLRQTYDNYELILVNDGSPDNCGAICEKFASQDNKITVLHLQNGGVCRARNAGMAIAKGDYFCFVDSDDWVGPNYLNDFIYFLEGDHTMVIQDAVREMPENNISNFMGYDQECFMVTENFAKLFAKYKSGIFGYPWNKIYSKKIVMDNDLKFDPSIKLGDDEHWNYRYFKYITKIVFVNRANYHYLYNPASISNQKRPFERELTRYRFRTDYFQFVLNNYPHKEKNLEVISEDLEYFFRLNIFDRMFHPNVNNTAEEIKFQLGKISTLSANQLIFLRSHKFFRNFCYWLLKNGHINWLYFLKKIKLKLN